MFAVEFYRVVLGVVHAERRVFISCETEARPLRTSIPGVTVGAEVYHAVPRALLAERRQPKSLHTDSGLVAGIDRARNNCDRCYLGMFLAESRPLASLDVEARSTSHAGTVQTAIMIVVYIDHAFHGMLFAERKLLAAPIIECRQNCAGPMCRHIVV